MNSQWERTRLAWSRTVLTVLAAVLLGALHFATAGFMAMAIISAALGVVACSAAAIRMLALKRGQVELPPWQPAVVSGAACLLAVSVIVVG